MTDAYPLSWPEGWPRTPYWKRESGSQFGRWTYKTAAEGLLAEVRRLGGRSIVISTNIPLRRDGLPLASARTPDDPGAAVYFGWNKKPIVMARDAFHRTEHNLRSLALAIAGLRQMERHGGAKMLEKAFEGFVALPPPGQTLPWWTVLGVRPEATPEQVDAAYRELARRHHPDVSSDGGSMMAAINAARDAYRRDRENG